MRPLAPILIALVFAGPAAAQDLGQAKAFVTGLYAAYARHPGPDYAGRQARQVFSPTLLALMRRDAARTPKGDVGTLDGDPICNCQDYEITSVEVAVTASGPAKARADVRFRNFGDPQSVTLDLVAAGGQWRVDDVHAEGTPSLAGLLKDALKAH
jgi:hypothetical protein